MWLAIEIVLIWLVFSGLMLNIFTTREKADQLLYDLGYSQFNMPSKIDIVTLTVFLMTVVPLILIEMFARKLK